MCEASDSAYKSSTSNPDPAGGQSNLHSNEWSCVHSACHITCIATGAAVILCKSLASTLRAGQRSKTKLGCGTGYRPNSRKQIRSTDCVSTETGYRQSMGGANESDKGMVVGRLALLKKLLSVALQRVETNEHGSQY